MKQKETRGGEAKTKILGWGQGEGEAGITGAQPLRVCQSKNIGGWGPKPQPLNLRENVTPLGTLPLLPF